MPSAILLCSDQPLQSRKTGLEMLGYSVCTALNASSAVAALEQSDLAVVLLDYDSMSLDAEQVALNIRDRFPKQPIILLSAHSQTPRRLLWLVDEYVMTSEPIERASEMIEKFRREPAKTVSSTTTETAPHVAA